MFIFFIKTYYFMLYVYVYVFAMLLYHLCEYLIFSVSVS